LFEESLALWRSLGDAVVVARSLSNLANVVKLQGDYELDRSLYEECLSTFRELGDRTGIAWSLNYEGDVAHEQGDDAGARALYEQRLTVFKELGDKWGIAGCLIDLARDALSPTIAAAAWMDGWTTPPDKAVRDAPTDE